MRLQRRCVVTLDLDTPEPDADGTRIPLVLTGTTLLPAASRVSGGSTPRVSRVPLSLWEAVEQLTTNYDYGGFGGCPPEFQPSLLSSFASEKRSTDS